MTERRLESHALAIAPAPLDLCCWALGFVTCLTCLQVAVPTDAILGEGARVVAAVQVILPTLEPSRPRAPRKTKLIVQRETVYLNAFKAWELVFELALAQGRRI